MLPPALQMHYKWQMWSTEKVQGNDVCGLDNPGQYGTLKLAVLHQEKPLQGERSLAPEPNTQC